LRPRKRLGQNFLQDRAILGKIADFAELSHDDTVIEIGAGTGTLTRELMARAGRTIAVELDDSLFEMLREDLGGRAEVLHANALDLDPCGLVTGKYKIVANIPYYITGQLLRHFLGTRCPPAVLVLLVQREVAKRMTAHPGDLSLLGVGVQFYASAEIVLRVPAGAFYPRPKVDSAVVRLVPHSDIERDVEQAVFMLARAGFSSKRKQLANSLATGLGIDRAAVLDLLHRAGIAPTRRAEELSIDEWKSLARLWDAGISERDA
jgi:16S rRNA (adenine1518-N6/adenine1519-N6)-dimethyltransferase